MGLYKLIIFEGDKKMDFMVLFDGQIDIYKPKMEILDEYNNHEKDFDKH